jgi:HlyD family secretion protein
MAKRKNRKRLYYILGALLVLLLILSIVGRRFQEKGLEIEVEKVVQRTLLETVSASGKIFPETEVKISSDVSGEVVELYVEEGDSVKQGQLLARVDPEAFQSAVERGEASVNNSKAQEANARAGLERTKAQFVQAKAQQEQIEAQLTNARAIHERNQELIKEGVISEADFDASLSNLDALRANLKSAEANVKSAEASLEAAKQSIKAASFTVKSAEASLKELKTSLRRTSIYAPMEGVVSKLNIELGERVVGTIQMAGTEMMRIADLSKMEVQVEVNENDVLRVSLEDEVDIEVDAYLDRKFKGKVKQIANSAEDSGVSGLATDQVTNFIVTINIDPGSYEDLVTRDQPFPFRPGMSAAVDVYTGKAEEVLSVPIQAVTTRLINEEDKDEEEVVFVMKEDTVDMVQVVTGIQDDTNIELKSGLKEGELVVTAPYSAISRELKKGTEVRVKEEEDKKK